MTEKATVEQPESGRIKRLDRLAWLLDDSIPVPGTNWKIGLDSLIGLIPGGGDLITGLVSAWLIFEAVSAGASRQTLVKMFSNLGIDLLVGVIPILGDIFDATWKANTRNVELLRKELEPAAVVAEQRRGNRALGFLALVGVLALTVLFVVFALWLGNLLWSQLTSMA